MTFTAKHLLSYVTSQAVIELEKLRMMWNESAHDFRRSIASNGAITAYVKLKNHWDTMCKLCCSFDNNAVFVQIQGILFLTQGEEQHPSNITIHDLEDIHSEVLNVLHMI